MNGMTAIFRLAVGTLAVASATAAGACTIGVADGSVSVDGRGLLWKSRMLSSVPLNEVVHVTASPYDYIGIRSQGGSVMLGLNAAGLSTGNSLVGSGAGGNGTFMRNALEDFDSVDLLRDYIVQEFSLGNLDNVTGCFPFLDASGDATMFEIDKDAALYEYSTQDPDRAAQNMLGWVVRANEFHARTDGTDEVTIGGRYNSGRVNVQGLISPADAQGSDAVDHDLSAKTITQGNQGSTGYEFMRYGPDRPLSTIARSTNCSSMTVQGVAPDEDPALATMWAMLGQANYAIAVPTWVRVADVPDCLADGEMMAARSYSLYGKGDETATQASTLPAEEHLFDEVDQLLEHWRSAGTPSVEEMHRVEHRMATDAYSLMDCLDNFQYDNKAPTVALQGTASGFVFDFTAAAADTDGTIDGYEWAFGDGDVSSEPSPSHTFDDPGWYLVSCTVLDDDGVSTTDWQHLNVVPGAIPGDANGDYVVDGEDVKQLAANWGEINATWRMGDFDDDDLVGPADASILAAHWTSDTGESTTVPEPSTLVLLAGCLLVCAWRERRC